MSDDLTEFRVSQLNAQIERLGYAVDKICDRIDKLEKDSFEKTIAKRFKSFLFFIYPTVMVFLLISNNADIKKINKTYNETSNLIDHIYEVVNMIG